MRVSEGGYELVDVGIDRPAAQIDADAWLDLQNAGVLQNQYLQCGPRIRTEWSFRMRPGH